MARYLFTSHDGFGLGHARRNAVIARALASVDPAAEVTLVTGIDVTPAWLTEATLSIVRQPPLVKLPVGGYRGVGRSFDDTIEDRRWAFLAAVERVRPDVVVVDRRPFGVGGELTEGLRRARQTGARIVLGLRDVLDDPDVVAEELSDPQWRLVPGLFDTILVYGSRRFCDHQREYGLPLEPIYCGWVVDATSETAVDPRLLVIAAGGGGDGDLVFRLAFETVERRQDWRAVLATGPYADLVGLRRRTASSPAKGRLSAVTDEPGLGPLFARAGAVLQMAGYNSTFEALAAGCRPILVPRRRPREQAIRASRLASLGLVDVIDEAATPADVSWLLDQPRRIHPERLETAGIALDGAHRTASVLAALAHRRQLEGLPEAVEVRR